MVLSTRLRCIVNYIHPDTKVIDVGTDHAQVPIYLAMNKLCTKVLGIDNKPGPLKIAQNNVNRYHVQNVVELLLHDGFGIKQLDHYNTVLIAGLGTATINQLLRDDCSAITRYIILSTANENLCIRSWAKTNNYYIEDEQIIYDKNVYYEIIVINKIEGCGLTTEETLFFGPINLKLKTPNFLAKWTKKLNHLEYQKKSFYQVKNFNWHKNITHKIIMIERNI